MISTNTKLLSFGWRLSCAKGISNQPLALQLPYRVRQGSGRDRESEIPLTILARQWSDNITECNNKKFPNGWLGLSQRFLRKIVGMVGYGVM